MRISIKKLHEYTTPEENIILRKRLIDEVEVVGYKWDEEHFDIPETFNMLPVNRLGDLSFYGSNLKTINLPPYIDYIGKQAFAVSNLTEIKIPKFVTILNDEAFFHCDQLKQVLIPPDSHLKLIGSFAFSLCTNLRSLELPAQVSICRGAFKGSGITSFYFNSMQEQIPASLFEDSELQQIRIDDHVKIIEEEAFSNCIFLEKIQLPRNLEIIQSHAFFNCTDLKSITIINFKEILNLAFSNCTSLKDVNILNAVPGHSRIAPDAFKDCKRLTEESKKILRSFGANL